MAVIGGDETSCRVTRLTRGGEYEFRIIAENRMGLGTPSEPTVRVKAQEASGELFIFFFSGVQKLENIVLKIKAKINIIFLVS